MFTMLLSSRLSLIAALVVSATGLGEEVGAKVLAFGGNPSGILGLGHEQDRTEGAEIPRLSGVSRLVCYKDHVLALMADGTVSSWGRNNHGQLGLGDRENRLAPTRIKSLSGVQSVASTGKSSFAVLGDGSLRAWGAGWFGQLGLGGKGEHPDRTVPTVLKGLPRVRAVACARKSAVALLADGTLRAWGSNHQGVLGLGSADMRVFEVPTAIPGLSRVKAVACGEDHVMALLDDGRVMAWGDGQHGQLGLGDDRSLSEPTLIPGLNQVRALSCGSGHTVALLQDGTAKAWGLNANGQLGVGDKKNRDVPTVVPNIPGGGVKAIACGGFHTLVLTRSGVAGWGSNKHGELERLEKGDHLVPGAIPALWGPKRRQVIAISCSRWASFCLVVD